MDILIIAYNLSTQVEFLLQVMTSLPRNHRLVYRRIFQLPKWAKNNNMRTILHFQAVDHQTEVLIKYNLLRYFRPTTFFFLPLQVFVNGIQAGSHTGGYDSFNFDISHLLKEDKTDQELLVIVEDPTESQVQLHLNTFTM